MVTGKTHGSTSDDDCSICCLYTLRSVNFLRQRYGAQKLADGISAFIGHPQESYIVRAFTASVSRCFDGDIVVDEFDVDGIKWSYILRDSSLEGNLVAVHLYW